MNNVVFKRIRIQNVRNHKETELVFNKGINTIIGKNGSGKSTYLLSIVSCLYGKNPEGIEISDMVNRKVNKNLLIEIEIDINDVSYLFRRAYKHDIYKNKILVYKKDPQTNKWIDVSQSSNTETYKFIENLLVPYEIFLTTVYFNQQNFNFFVNTTDSQKKDLFDKILRLQDWQLFYEKAKEYKQKKHNEGQTIEKNMLILETKIKEKEQNFLQRLQEIREINNENEKMRTQIKQNIQELEQRNGILQENINNIEQILNQEKNIEQLNTELLELLDKRQNLLTNYHNNKQMLEQQKKTETEALVGWIRNIIEQHKLALEKELHEKIVQLNQKKNQYMEENNLAKEKLNQELKKLITQKNQEQEQYLININSNNQSIQGMYQEINRLQDEYRKNVQTLTKERDQKYLEQRNIQTQINKVTEQIGLLDEQIELMKETIKQSTSGQHSVCPVCKQIIKDVKAIEHIQNEINNKQNLKQQLYIQYTELENQLAKNQNSIKDIQESINKEELTISQKIKQLQEDIVNIKNINKQQQEALNIIEQKYRQLEEEIDKNIEQQYSIINEKIKIIEKEIQDTKISYNKTFEEKQKILKQEYQKNIEEIEQKYQEKMNELDLGLNVLAQIDNNIQQTKRKLEELNKLYNEKETIAQEIVNNNLNIENKKQMLLNIKDINEEIFIQNHTNEVKDIRSQYETLETRLQEIKKEIEIYDFWVEGFGKKGIPSYLIDTCVPQLNNFLKEVIEAIAPNKFMIALDTTSELKSGELRNNISIKVLNLETGADSVHILSSGEKRIIDICFMFAFKRLCEFMHNKQFNIMFFDEILDSIDIDNAERICALFRRIGYSWNLSIILISHSLEKISYHDQLLTLSHKS